jgi:predicted esterase
MAFAATVLSVGLVMSASVAEVSPITAPVGEMVEGIACASDPTQTYTLYLPAGFEPDRKWPVLLIFDPRGRSVLAAELFREAADAYGWILVSSDNTRSDGPMEPNVVALRALWPEVHTRLPAQFDRIYTAGFSGGAAVAYVLSRSTRDVAGIIACGGRFLPDDLEGNDVAIFSTAGDTDFNYLEMHRVDEFLAEQGNPHRLVIFEGSHAWMPPSLAGEAVAWFELLAMKNDLRPTDSDFVSSLYAEDVAKAEELEGGDRLVAAVRRYREITATYGGLLDTAAASDAARRLGKSAELRRQQKELKRWKSFERDTLQQMNRQVYELRNSEIVPAAARLARGLRIDELNRRKLEPGVEGVTARRVLNALSSLLNFYLPADFSASGQYDRLAVSYELAVRVREDNATAWYNLACARALLGREDSAVEALERAFEHGFDRGELVATDPDLDSLRDREDFKALLALR